jgi:hypothetical protein
MRIEAAGKAAFFAKIVQFRPFMGARVLTRRREQAKGKTNRDKKGSGNEERATV